jgi:hypothetical protein
MRRLSAWIEGIGLIGPGLDGWHASAPLLAEPHRYRRGPTAIPMPAGLAPAERRRVGHVVRLALGAGLQAVGHAGVDPASLPAVFTSSGGDGSNCHAICEALCSDERQISPTRFHNSVHNAAAGYWGIATGARTAANALCAFDASFAAGLLEALVQGMMEASRVLLVAYDAPYPPPLDEARPIGDAFAVGLALAPHRSAGALAEVRACIGEGAAPPMDHPALEALRRSIPAARSLPLLERLAGDDRKPAVLEYLPGQTLHVEVHACR